MRGRGAADDSIELLVVDVLGCQVAQEVGRALLPVLADGLGAELARERVRAGGLEIVLCVVAVGCKRKCDE